MNNIVVPVDFSEQTEDALQLARNFGRALDAKIWLLHIAAPEPDFVGYDAGPDTVRKQVAKELREEHAKVQELVIAEKTLDVHMAFGVRLPDRNEAFGLEIRRGVAQFHESLPEYADLVLEINRSTLEDILLGEVESTGIDGVYTPQAGLAASFRTGKAKLTKGSPEDFQMFFGYFEPLTKEPIPITVR